MNDILGILALFGLVLLNGYFVAAEFALVSVRRTRIDQLADEGNATAKVTRNQRRDNGGGYPQGGRAPSNGWGQQGPAPHQF